VLFKKNVGPKCRPDSVSYGASGALLGGTRSAYFCVWVAILGIRVLGTVAETEVKMPLARKCCNRWSPLPHAERGAEFREPGLVQMKHALEQGTAAGGRTHGSDSRHPLLDLGKSRRDDVERASVERFMKHPG
jgi:hypothetical protein